jgi:hypothetical protein
MIKAGPGTRETTSATRVKFSQVFGEGMGSVISNQ